MRQQFGTLPLFIVLMYPSHMNGYVRVPDTDHRDTLVAALVGSGRKLPNAFIEHKPAKRKRGVVIEKAVSGINTELMITWLKTIFLPNREDIKYLLLDKASAHTALEVKKFCQNNDINLVYFPTKTAPELSPLDNSYFSQLKSKIKTQPISTFAEKQQTINEITEEISHENVQHYFAKCDY